jgi:hypothetical protein
MSVRAAQSWPADQGQLIPFAMADGRQADGGRRRIVRMIVRRCLRDLVLGAVIAGLAACAGTARSASAHEFVAAIYAVHVGPNQGFALDADADFRRYFEPALAARMIRAAHEAWDNRNRAWLDDDVFVDAEAWSFTAAHVAIARRGRHRAIAIVTPRSSR